MINKHAIKQTLVAILLATPALADPPGSQVLRRFHDWTLDCTAQPCILHASVTGTDGSEVLRLAAIAGPQLAVTTPLPLYLPDGLTLSVGDLDPRSIVWRTCRPAGCEALTPLDPVLAAALKRERSGTITLTLEQGVPVRLAVSLRGYTAATRARGD